MTFWPWAPSWPYELVIFPEGIITRTNDCLGALIEGTAFIARSAAKQRAKSEPGARTLLVPVALRYRFLKHRQLPPDQLALPHR